MRSRLPRALRRWSLPWRGRGLAVMAAVAAVAMLAGALTAVQIRAAQAQEARDAAAEQAAAERAAAAEEAARRAEARAWLDDFHARSDRYQAWAVAAQQAGIALDDADAALAGAADAGDDDAVGAAVEALAGAAQQVRDLLAGAPEEPDASATTALTEATAVVVTGTAAVLEAHAAWRAEQERVAEEEAQREARARAAGGAGADCGGSGIREPSRGGAVLHTSVPAEEGDGSNGNVPRSAMTALSWCTDSRGNQQWLRTDAAEALARLNEAFRAEFGENIAIDLSYRSYADQVRARELYGSLAARPGTSNHGWGTAIDTWEWAAYDFGTPRYDWLVANGPSFGWHNPAATDPGNPEYWHYEYRG